MGTLLRLLSYLAILGFPLAVLGKRLGLFDFGVAFKLLSYTVYLSLAILMVGLIIALWKRNRNPQQSKAAFMAALLCLIPLLGIGSQIVTGKKVPPIHNISTDVVDPPQFDVIKTVRSSGDNSLNYDAAKLAGEQQRAYPEIETLVKTMTVEEAYVRALSIVYEMGWKVVSENKQSGIIEATETTKLWAFKDDIVVRIRPLDNDQNLAQIEIDLRSVSRIGSSDLGANAKRIITFLDAFGR